MIGREIVSGGIAEGDVLPRELELAEKHGLGRQAVREALKVLAAKGLINTRRRAGSFVLPRREWNLLDPDVLAWHPPEMLPPKFLRDLVELRRVIEPEAAALAATRASPEDIAAISTAIADMRSSEPVSEAFFAADSQFHISILTASNNVLIGRLSATIRPLMEATFPIHYQGVAAELNTPAAIAAAVDESIRDHAAVHEAIVNRDPALAAERMKSLVTRVSKEVDFFVDHRPEDLG